MIWCLQEIINGLAGCLLRAKDDMESPSGKRLVRLSRIQCTSCRPSHERKATCPQSARRLALLASQ